MKSVMKIFQSLLFFMVIGALFSSGCSREEKPLVIYSGGGLEKAMQEVRDVFEAKHKVKIHIIYAGSKSLLTAIRKSGQGDIYIPGAVHFLEQAGALVPYHYLVARHVPVFAVRKENSPQIHLYDDLLRKDVSIAVGNKDTCAIGKVADKLMEESEYKEKVRENMVVMSSTVNELLHVLNQGQVDAALIWLDMLQWPEAAGLVRVAIPDMLNLVQPIHVGVLSTSTNRKRADIFAEFMRNDGRDIFIKHGFGE